MGLEGQARIAAVKSIGGSMEGADSMAHGIWEATAAPASPMTINGVGITFTNTYPAAVSIGLLLDPSTTTGYSNPNPGEYVPNGATTAATCNATYASCSGCRAAQTYDRAAGRDLDDHQLQLEPTGQAPLPRTVGEGFEPCGARTQSGALRFWRCAA